MNMINYEVDDTRSLMEVPEGFEIEDTRIAACMKLKMFNLLLDINKKTSKGFTDNQIADIVNMTYKNAYNVARLGIHAGYWKYDEEMQEVMDAVKDYNILTAKHSKEKSNRYYNSLASFCKENVCRELASALNMFVKAYADIHFMYKDHIKVSDNAYDFIVDITSYMLETNIITVEGFHTAFQKEYNEFADATLAFDTAIDIINGVESTYDDVVLHILKMRTPELIDFSHNHTNKLKFDKKIFKELRVLYRAKYSKGE